MGWALYRMGRLRRGRAVPRARLRGAPGPRDRSTLGEVLWAKGQQQKAKEIWQSQLKATPDHPLLLETVRRHAP